MTCWAAEAPEVGPETGYSSIGGMLPYWVPPQGGFYGTRHLPSPVQICPPRSLMRHPLRRVTSSRTVVSAMAGSQFPVRELKSTQALFATR